MPNKNFTPELLSAIVDAAIIEDVVSELIPLRPKGADLVGICPKCGKKDKFSVNKAKKVAKCFSCGDKGWNTKTIINLVMHIKGCDFPEAVIHLVNKYGLHHYLAEAKVTVHPAAKKKPTKTTKTTKTPKTPPNTAVRTKPTTKGNFRDRTLAESGITQKMQRGKVIEKNSEYPDFDRYTVGTLDPKNDWKVAENDINMIMHYVGLDRRCMTYIPSKGSRTPRPMVRCRFENPAANTIHGKPTKYISPKGSGTPLWLPNRLIDDYNIEGRTAQVLTFQEGEKKADRFCKIVPSVGIMGIHSLAKMDDEVPMELQSLQAKFGFDTYIFFMDADLFELGNGKEMSVDHRPRTFANAAKKYRQHIHKFQTGEKRINILLAHPTTLDQGIKGVDDLMESGLITDKEMQKAISEGIKGKDHELVKFYDLTTRTDEQIDELWHLGTHNKFAEHYHEKIQAIHGTDSFRLGKQKRKFNEKGELEFDQPLLPIEEFYDWIVPDKGNVKVTFSDTKLLKFLANRGFFRFRESALLSQDETFNYIKVEDNTVVKIPAMDIRDFILEFLDDNEDRRLFIRDHFRRNHENFLGIKTFCLLPYKIPSLLKDQRACKFFAFKTPNSPFPTIWRVTPEGVSTKIQKGKDVCVWRSSLINDAPHYVGPIFTLTQITSDLVAATTTKWKPVYAANVGRYILQPTKQGKNCVFYQFLNNASNYYWEKYELAVVKKANELRETQPDTEEKKLEEQARAFLDMDENSPYSLEEQFETQQHLIAKITTIGHLSRKYRSPDADYWVYAMEGNLIEDQASEGRSGKSLLPLMLAYAVNRAWVDGTKDMEKDIYLWDKVTHLTTFIDYDDARRGKVRIDSLYSRQTGDFGVRAMHKGEILIPKKDAPIGYMSSNFNLLNSQGSTRDRWRAITFSDFYTADRKPQDIHGHHFYSDWDEEEKARFFSFIADCSTAYFKLGGVKEAPSDRVDQRLWHGEIGQKMLDWFDRTFKRAKDNGCETKNIGIPLRKLVVQGVEGETTATPEAWSFYAQEPKQKAYVTDRKFKRRFWLCCLLKGFVINDGRECDLKMLEEFHGLGYGGDDKHDGAEWITLTEPGVVNKKEAMPF